MCCTQPQSAEDFGGMPAAEASVLVVLVEALVVLVLVPHRIGHHVVEALQPRALGGEARRAHRVARWRSGVGVVVQEHVHLRHGEGDGVQLLAEEPRRLGALLGMALLEEHARLDE